MARILQSLFFDTNTPDHYSILEQLIISLLQGDTQNVLPLILPALFYAQTVAIQKSEVTGSIEELLHYLDSASAITSSSSLFSKLATPTAPQSPKSMYLMVLPLDTVQSEGEEEEEEERRSNQPHVSPSDTAGEILLTPTENGSYDECD